MIARRVSTVRKRYKVLRRGVEAEMLARYMRRITSQSCPVVLSITDAVPAESGTTIIQRNEIRYAERSASIDIYGRAREIYYRARRQRPVRAASIF